MAVKRESAPLDVVGLAAAEWETTAAYKTTGAASWIDF